MSKSINRAIRHSALAAALGMCLASTALAQSNTTGTVYGTAEPGTTVTIQNESGLQRNVVVGADGRYRVGSLPVGNYSVTSDKTTEPRTVTVVIGGGAEVNFGGAKGNSDAVSVGTVRVRGTRIGQGIDVSQTDTRSVFTSEQLKNIPVQNSIAAVALLAPGVVQADSRYGNTASFGGSAASENAFYINGFPVTNPLTNLGSTTLPFDGISQQQVITGGYGAEFGRSTGGVVNVVTKRGTNEFHHGAAVFWTPENLRSKYTNIYYENTGANPATDGTLYRYKENDTYDQMQAGMYVTGPIVKDKLFFYASGEFNRNQDNYAAARPGSASTGWTQDKYAIPRWLVKLDWNISANHALEFTGIGDVTEVYRDQYAYQYTGATPPNAPGTVRKAGGYFKDGGNTYIGKYTGHFGDNFTVSAMYGEQDQDHINLPSGYDPSVVYVSDTRSVANPISKGTVATVVDPNQFDKVKATRLDLEYVLGSHTFRLGYDGQDATSRRGSGTSGPGYRWAYASVGPKFSEPLLPSAGGAVAPGGNGDYVMKVMASNAGTVQTKQKAYYLEDRWQVTDNLLLSLGVRNDSFTNYNGDGIAYVEQKNQWAPRIGATWDVRGDSSLKVFANVGRYHLAMPNNVAFRGAGSSLNTTEYFAFTGIDPTTGAPTGLRALGNGPFSPNQEYGQARDPNIVSATDLQPHFQDEAAFGFQSKLGTDYSWGARYVYRTLRSAIDDICDPRAAYKWAKDNGFGGLPTFEDDYHSGVDSDAMSMANTLYSCALYNPGEDNTFNLVDLKGNYHQATISAEDLGFDKLKRIYQGLDLYIEHPFNGKWYGRVDYTYSRNYGNAEGQLKSDIGQTDVSVTADFDLPELMEYADGDLPNDRPHYLKAFGFYQWTPEWQTSATIRAMAGRPLNCMGYRPTALDPFYASELSYGNYHHYCNNQPSPRGSAGRLPWTNTLDLGVNYIPAWADKKLRFGVDVFNVTNTQVAQNVIERNEKAPGVASATARQVVSYNAPRSVRFSVRYDF